ENLTVHFSNTSSDIYDASWDFGDGTTRNGNEVLHSYTKPGNYKVRLTAFNRNIASDTISKQVLVGTNSSDNYSLLDEIKIYPNPSTTTLYFEGITEPFDIKVFNLDGKIL